jgi:NAD(P)-dependent dehydrogenase (short-subunit alcohol dehydrogenase family)
LKTILITGATSGIGQALALLAARKGYQVIACGRNLTALNTLSKTPAIVTLNFDVTDEAATKKALASVTCDIAVLNAGNCEYVDVSHFECRIFQDVFAVNFFGVIHCIAGLLPNLSQGNQVVIIDSMARLLPFTRSQAYGASKAAIHYVTKSLDVDLRAQGISVQSVSPGFVETPLTNKNNFEMPMKITAEQAAIALLKGIERKHANIYFPTMFGIILRTLSKLPSSMTTWLSSKTNA